MCADNVDGGECQTCKIRKLEEQVQMLQSQVLLAEHAAEECRQRALRAEENVRHTRKYLNESMEAAGFSADVDLKAAMTLTRLDLSTWRQFAVNLADVLLIDPLHIDKGLREKILEQVKALKESNNTNLSLSNSWRGCYERLAQQLGVHNTVGSILTMQTEQSLETLQKHTKELADNVSDRDAFVVYLANDLGIATTGSSIQMRSAVLDAFRKLRAAVPRAHPGPEVYPSGQSPDRVLAYAQDVLGAMNPEVRITHDLRVVDLLKAIQFMLGYYSQRQIVIERIKDRQEYWYWEESHGFADANSITCPIIIRPELLRVILQQRDEYKTNMANAEVDQRHLRTVNDELRTTNCQMNERFQAFMSEMGRIMDVQLSASQDDNMRRMKTRAIGWGQMYQDDLKRKELLEKLQKDYDCLVQSICMDLELARVPAIGLSMHSHLMNGLRKIKADLQAQRDLVNKWQAVLGCVSHHLGGVRWVLKPDETDPNLDKVREAFIKAITDIRTQARRYVADQIQEFLTNSKV